jgi:cell division protein FtsB
MELTGQIILTTFTAIIGYIFGYKKNQNDIENGRLDNLEKSIKVYQVLVDDLSNRIETLSVHISKLESQIDALIKENKRLKSKKTIQE